MYEGKLGNILVFRDAPPGGRSDTVESVAALLDTGEFFRDAANRLWRSAGQRSDVALAGVKQSTLRPSRASQARSAQPARVSERAITPTCAASPSRSNGRRADSTHQPVRPSSTSTVQARVPEQVTRARIHTPPRDLERYATARACHLATVSHHQANASPTVARTTAGASYTAYGSTRC